MVKKIKNGDAEEGADAVGEEIEPVARAARYEIFLQHFGQATVEDADDDGQQQSSFLIGFSIGNELFAIAPEAEEGEGGIHKEMHHLVEADDGLDMGQTRTRNSCQNHDDDSAQESRVAISGQTFQEVSQS